MLMSTEHRDLGLEMKLQYAMDNGMGVWVLGEIHGHIDTLKELISRINLEDGDQLVSLGDMIDRGPDSASVLGMFRENPSFHAVKGNHEQLMHRANQWPNHQRMLAVVPSLIRCCHTPAGHERH